MAAIIEVRDLVKTYVTGDTYTARAQGRVTDRRGRRVPRDHGAVRLGQVDADEPARPARHADERHVPHPRRRRVVARRDGARRGPRARDRLRLPVVQPAPAHDASCATSRCRSIYARTPEPRARGQGRRGDGGGRADRRSSTTSSPTRSPAVRCSASRSRARSSTTRRSSSPTSPPATSTRSPATTSSRRSSGCATRAAPSCSSRTSPRSPSTPTAPSTSETASSPTRSRRWSPMRLKDLLTETFLSLTANKARSFLTILGIVVGITSVIVMVAFGQGTKASITVEHLVDGRQPAHDLAGRPVEQPGRRRRRRRQHQVAHARGRRGDPHAGRGRQVGRAQ